MTPLLVALGACMGATLRFWVAQRLDGRWPAGTLLVNVAGSFVLGLLVGAGVSHDGLALLGTGFCGGLTTYSAFAVQTHDQGVRRGATYAAATIALALGACAIGFALGQA
ncbi:MAG: CrcB family protein [Nocardioides sp.]